MGLTSVTFIFFLLAVCLLYYIMPRAVRSFWLLACSYLFYLYNPANLWLVGLLLGATLATWAAALAVEMLQAVWARRIFLILGMAVCLGSLLFFKYASFFAGITQDLLAVFGVAFYPPVLDFAVPLGISYFTFQALGYLFDVYKRKYAAEKNVLYYALFVSFFPCIVQGPILRADKMLGQLRTMPAFDYNTFSGGAFRILLGFFKKLVLADTIGSIISPVFKNYTLYSGPVLAVASLAFAYQLYCDFSAGCDIAIGASACLGLEVTENFRRPLAAATFTDLWRRWHISLTSWLRDYIYIPLGGNRKGKVRTYVNSLTVFLVSGIWHGASWNYVLWGFLNGVLLSIGKATAPLREKLNVKNPFFTVKALRPFKRVVQTCFTYSLFSACLVFFCVDLYGGNIATAFSYFGQMFTGWGAGAAALCSTYAVLGLNWVTALVLGAGILCTDLRELPDAPVHRTIRKVPIYVRWPLYYALALSILFFGAFGQSAFIYQAY